MKHLAVLFVTIFLAFISVAHAAAEALTAYPIDVQEPLSYLVSLILAAITGVGGFLLALFKQKTGVKLNPEHEAYLENAFASALLYANDRAQAYIARIDDPFVRSRIVADTANFVLGNVPVLLKQLGITPDQLRLMIADRLNEKGVFNGPAQPPR